MGCSQPSSALQPPSISSVRDTQKTWEPVEVGNTTHVPFLSNAAVVMEMQQTGGQVTRSRTLSAIVRVGGRSTRVPVISASDRRVTTATGGARRSVTAERLTFS